MRFIDQVRVQVQAGRGGDGMVGWRREKYVPRGGPAGGDGGHGGDVVLVADERLTTLLDLKYRQHLRAEPGHGGGSRDKHGRDGENLVVRVPVGTAVFLEATVDDPGEAPPLEVDDSEVLGDLVEPDQRLVVARGGKGGHGNTFYRSSTNRAPTRADPGLPGEAFWLRLELKLLADVGIVGYPNVGKSTLISRISRARPKIADYPFTTLVPQLGVVALDRRRGDQPSRTMVVADVPGLIRGASHGRGLGHAFLRHLERTRVLLHLIAPDPDPAREPVRDLDAIENELAGYGPVFEGKPRVVALNKSDLLAGPEGQEQLAAIKKTLRAREIPVFPISAQTGDGIQPLLEALWRRLHRPASRASEPGGGRDDSL